MWQAQHEHPFVRGIGDGSLDLERFRHWVRQDYRFLIEYCRLFGLAAARAPDLDTLARFADLLQATARTEMDLHRAYAAELGITAARARAGADGADHARVHRFPAARRGHRRLRRAGRPRFCPACGASRRSGHPRRPGAAGRPRYAKWIRIYADPEFAALAGWCRDLLDRLAAGADGAARRRMEDAFLTSSRYEYLFWEMAWRLETWPV